MINTQDLRIRNLVQVEVNEMDWQYAAVIGIELNTVEVETLQINPGTKDKLDQNEVHPIPLTEKWLEAFGFEKIDKNVFRYEIAPDAHVELINSHGYFYPHLSKMPELSHEHFYIVPVNRLNSVHWLQNLVYFNYEKELELNTIPSC